MHLERIETAPTATLEIFLSKPFRLDGFGTAPAEILGLPLTLIGWVLRGEPERWAPLRFQLTKALFYGLSAGLVLKKDQFTVTFGM